MVEDPAPAQPPSLGPASSSASSAASHTTASASPAIHPTPRQQPRRPPPLTLASQGPLDQAQTPGTGPHLVLSADHVTAAFGPSSSFAENEHQYGIEHKHEHGYESEFEFEKDTSPASIARGQTGPSSASDSAGDHGPISGEYTSIIPSPLPIPLSLPLPSPTSTFSSHFLLLALCVQTLECHR